MRRIVEVKNWGYKNWHLALGATLITILSLTIGVGLNLGPTDDAFITYRHAENFARGHGLVFNPGQPVEGTSNFLFAVLVGILCALKIPPIWGSSLINHVSLFAIAYLLLRDLSARLQNAGRSSLFAHLGLAFLVLSPSLVFFVWVGLETPFYTALLFASSLLLLEGAYKAEGGSSSGDRRGMSWMEKTLPREAWRPLLASGVFWGLAAATRMEAVIVGPAFAVLLINKVGIKKFLVPLGLVLLACLLVFLPVFVYRWSYYGYPFPNTYYAKVDGGTWGLLIRGLQYISLFVNMYAVYFGVVFLLILRSVFAGKDRPRALFMVNVFLMQVFYVIYVGGDFFPYLRFLLPVFPIVALGFGDVIAFGLRRNPWTIPPGRSVAFRTVQVVLIGLLIGCVGLYALVQPAHVILAASQQNSVKKRSAVGKMLKRNVPGDMSLLVGAAGAIPYYSKLKSYDAFGLTDPFLAHKQVYLGPGRPGHEKIDILGQIRRYRPDLILFYSMRTEHAMRTRSQETETRFYYQVEEIKKNYNELIEYVALRLEGPGAVAMVTARKSVLHRLGPMFETITPPPEDVGELSAVDPHPPNTGDH